MFYLQRLVCLYVATCSCTHVHVLDVSNIVRASTHMENDVRRFQNKLSSALGKLRGITSQSTWMWKRRLTRLASGIMTDHADTQCIAPELKPQQEPEQPKQSARTVAIVGGGPSVSSKVLKLGDTTLTVLGMRPFLLIPTHLLHS